MPLKRLHLLAVVVLLTVLAHTAPGNAPTIHAQSAQPLLTPLTLYWNGSRSDNFTTGTVDGMTSAVNAGYTFIRTEGLVYSIPQPGTVPLELFWNGSRSDNFTTGTADGQQSAVNAGYSLIRVEGYIYPTQQPGTVPLKTYWNGPRLDNFTTATIAGSQSAVNAGYTFIRVEGYVYPASMQLPVPFQTQLGSVPGGNTGIGYLNCGPASIAMAIDYFAGANAITPLTAANYIRSGGNFSNNSSNTINNSSVTDFTGTNDSTGVWSTNLLNYYGLTGTPVYSYDDIRKSISNNKPVIVLINNNSPYSDPGADLYGSNYTSPLWYTKNHIVVVTGYDVERVYVNDPLRAPYIEQNPANYPIPMQTFITAATTTGSFPGTWHAISVGR